MIGNKHKVLAADCDERRIAQVIAAKGSHHRLIGDATHLDAPLAANLACALANVELTISSETKIVRGAHVEFPHKCTRDLRAVVAHRAHRINGSQRGEDICAEARNEEAIE